MTPLLDPEALSAPSDAAEAVRAAADALEAALAEAEAAGLAVRVRVVEGPGWRVDVEGAGW